MNLSIAPVQGRLGTSRRASASVSFWNPLGGLDQLVNGNNLKGWGQAGFSDPTLLYVNGFDASTRRFRYEVNPRFGDARASRTSFRAPFRVVLEARFQLGPDADRQQLSRELAQGRGRKGTRMSAAQFRATYTRGGLNPVPRIMGMRDSLDLTTAQVDSLNRMQRTWQASVDSLWLPTSEWVEKLGDTYDLDDGLARVRETKKLVQPVTVRYLDGIRTILSADQMRKLPSFMQLYFDPSYQRMMGEIFIIFP